MNKPNSEALRRGLYVGAVVQDALDKKQYTITHFDEDGDPMWNDYDGDFALNCELVPGQKRRFATSDWMQSDGVRYRYLHMPEPLYDEALAVLAAHFEGRK